MKIQKLTITPVIDGCPSFIRLNPSTKDATLLISEKLAHTNNQYNSKRPARALRKMPKWMKGFVNPKTLVVKERKFDVKG